MMLLEICLSRIKLIFDEIWRYMCHLDVRKFRIKLIYIHLLGEGVNRILWHFGEIK